MNIQLFPNAPNSGTWLLMARDTSGSLHVLGVFPTLASLEAVFPTEEMPNEFRTLFVKMWAVQVEQLLPLY